LDLLQIAEEGLMPNSQYEVFLAQNGDAPFGKLEPLATFMTNPDGSGIVQAIGPLKRLANDAGEGEDEACPRFLIVTELNNPTQVVLRQAGDSSSDQD
jgi:hypothetical protein